MVRRKFRKTAAGTTTTTRRKGARKSVVVGEDDEDLDEINEIYYISSNQFFTTLSGNFESFFILVQTAVFMERD